MSSNHYHKPGIFVTRQYAMLVLPSSNRVYNTSASKLAHAELQAFNVSALNDRVSDIDNTHIAGVPYLTFRCQDLTTTDIAYLSNLSFMYALFEIASDDDQGHFLPQVLAPLDRYDSDLLSILKFAGKTNEQFTRLLLNVTIMASSSASRMLTNRLRVLDPLCGRGTTLNQALMYGFDACGIEIDSRDFDAYGVFINRWLKDKRLKHSSELVQLRKEGKEQAQRLTVQLASDKEAYKAGDVQKIDVIQSDTLRAGEFFKKQSFDLIVADLPYGVKHGSRSAAGITKSPLHLLEECLPVWVALLNRGGTIGLSWNTYLARKVKVISLLEQAGLTLSTLTDNDHYRHRVDQAIIRDMIVARRT